MPIISGAKIITKRIVRSNKYQIKERPIASALHKLVKKLRSYTIHRRQMPESSYDIRP